MSFKSRFSAYNALFELQPAEIREVVSQFSCAIMIDDGNRAVLGVWVTIQGIQVEPFYLTENQLEELKNNVVDPLGNLSNE